MNRLRREDTYESDVCSNRDIHEIWFGLRHQCVAAAIEPRT